MERLSGRTLAEADQHAPRKQRHTAHRIWARLREEHGRVLLWEGHSIRSRVPFLFEGRLPDLNLGTASGSSCSPALQARLEALARRNFTAD